MDHWTTRIGRLADSGAANSSQRFTPAPGAGSPPPRQTTPLAVSFDRKELSVILNVYGKKVASGEWRDYALDMLKDRALFSIYQRTSERPLYIVEKNPKLARKQGQYLVINRDGKILRRGHDLAAVLRVLDPQLYLVR